MLNYIHGRIFITHRLIFASSRGDGFFTNCNVYADFSRVFDRIRTIYYSISNHCHSSMEGGVSYSCHAQRHSSNSNPPRVPPSPITSHPPGYKPVVAILSRYNYYNAINMNQTVFSNYVTKIIARLASTRSFRWGRHFSHSSVARWAPGKAMFE